MEISGGGVPNTQKRRKCPACGAARVARILYGLPAGGPRLERDLAAGRIVLGGCCVSEGMPLWRCAVCGHEWGSLSLESEVRDPSERRSAAPVDERIARLETPEGAEQFAINVEAMGLPDLALAARRRAVELRAAAHGAKTAAERERSRPSTPMSGFAPPQAASSARPARGR
jgi:ribosomal protein L37AE/L43A